MTIQVEKLTAKRVDEAYQRYATGLGAHLQQRFPATNVQFVFSKKLRKNYASVAASSSL